MTQLYMIPDFKCFEESGDFSKEQGLCFEYNDFIFPAMLDDEKAVEERIVAYKSLGRDCSKDTMHGAFFDVTVFSYDTKIREVSMLRMRQSMEIAKKMGLRGVVFHGNHCPFLHGETYDTHWLDCTEEAIRVLAKEYPETEIFMENMFDDTPEILTKLVKRLFDVKTFGICLDYSHALLISKEGRTWFEQLSNSIRHIHVNDHCFAGDVHLAPGAGMTDWDEFFRLKEQYAPEATILCEVSGIERTRQGIEFLKNKM